MLKVHEINTYYDQSHILRDLSLGIEKGEVATLLGRNGAGKTTTVKSIMGIQPPRSGSITFNGVEISGMRPHKISKMGAGFVPEERRIFPSLTVLENLNFPVWGRGEEGWGIEKVYEFFPVLRSRSANKGSELSGGEQQMLAMARILRAKMDLILLDEPTEGLAPLLVRSIGTIIREIKNDRLTILLIEQNTRFASDVADRHHILYGGKIAFEGTNEVFVNSPEVQKKYLGV